jgi:hypothetical protein
MRTRLFVTLLLACVLAIPGFADTVYLKNGRSFEGVIAEVGDASVKIQMPGGSLSLPLSHVLRVEKSASGYAEYLDRKAALKREGAGAADWLKLSRWAKSEGLDQVAREAALAAADRDPRLEGLAPLLRSYGYVLDPQLERWIPYADAMRRQGLVQWNGQWISREEQTARLRAEQEELSQRHAERAAARAAQATQAAREAELALAETELRARISESSAAAAIPYAAPLVVFPWFVPAFPVQRPCHHCGDRSPQNPQPQVPFIIRQEERSGTPMHVPGSLIPF